MKDITRVSFFKKDGVYCCKYGKKNYILSDEIIEKLKESLVLPYALQFYGCRDRVIADIMFDMHNKDAECDLQRFPDDEKTGETRYAAIYVPKKISKTK